MSSKKNVKSSRKTPSETGRGFADVEDLHTFRATTLALPKHECLLLVDQALLLIDQHYIDLPKQEMLPEASHPIRRLRLLRSRIEHARSGDSKEAAAFHQELGSIFLSLRDPLTSYLLPAPFSNKVAFVPFLVEECFESRDGELTRRYLVTRLFDGFQEPHLVPGVEVLRWNGIPIARAVELNGARVEASSLEERLTLGIRTLTVRPLSYSLPPEEDDVLVEYRTADDLLHQLKVPWLVSSALETVDAGDLMDISSEAASAQAIDLEQAALRSARKLLFAPEVVAGEARMARRRAAARARGLSSMIPGVLEARPVTTEAGEIGYVRIWTFCVSDADAFVAEFIRLVEQLPQDGLVIDVRGNDGGLIWAGEQLLQVLTPRLIQPILFQFRNTPLNLRLAEHNVFLWRWYRALREALEVGGTYSAGYPITDLAAANAVGQRYHGPVLLITDPICYGATDIFAAGFRDHGIGQILRVNGNVAAGGVNAWGQDLLQQLAFGVDSPYQPLPGSARMWVSVRRAIRMGASEGTALEDLGVVPDMVLNLTQDDLLEGNRDLITAAADLLARQPKRRLKVQLGDLSGQGQDVTVSCEGLTRVDVYLNGRPLGSLDVTNGANTFTLPAVDNGSLGVRGFSDDALVAARFLRL
jgi:hypothetical protein